MKFSVFWFALVLSLTTLPARAAERVVLITLDGVRCQEMFQGLDHSIWQAQNEGKAIEETELYRNFWAGTPEERRRRSGGEGVCRRRLGERQPGHRGTADLGRGRQACRDAEDHHRLREQ